jgi:S1-C subfamily serine protease
VGGRPVEGGCEVSIVNPDSAAAKACLRLGVLIVAFNVKSGSQAEVA